MRRLIYDSQKSMLGALMFHGAMEFEYHGVEIPWRCGIMASLKP